MPVSVRARTEAYAGLLLLLFALTVLAFNRGEPKTRASRVFSGRRGISNDGWSEKRPIGTGVKVEGVLPEKEGISVAVGNAMIDGVSQHGWWVGHFVNEKSGRHSKLVETKWAVHPKGASHDGLVYNRQATTMAILISGKHRVILPDADVLLEYAGDYVIWGPNIAHSWTAVENSVILTVRWPSVQSDQSSSGAERNDWTSDKGEIWNKSENRSTEVIISKSVRHALMARNLTATRPESNTDSNSGTENASVTSRASVTETATETANIK